jgi:hypothetical protein
LPAKEPAAQGEWLGLLTAIAESQDDSERRRGELALAIFLLGIDHDLGPDDYSRLLTFPPGDLRAEMLRADFRALARLHAEAVWPRMEEPLVPPAHFRWPGFSFRRGKSRRVSRC